jgi:hypothetical protein
MLEDFQNKENKPQIHTVLEVIPAKTKDGEFIFPLKEEYEKRRNIVSASSSSDKDIAQDITQSKDKTISDTPEDKPKKGLFNWFRRRDKKTQTDTPAQESSAVPAPAVTPNPSEPAPLATPAARP